MYDRMLLATGLRMRQLQKCQIALFLHISFMGAVLIAEILDGPDLFP